MNLANLEIEMVAIHQIYKYGEYSERYRLNNSISVLDENSLNVIKNRVVEALGEDTKSIELQIVHEDEESTFQKLASMIYAESNEFLEISKDLTIHLASKQNNSRIPGGIIVFFRGTVRETNKYIVVLKAECQEGFALTTAGANIDLTYIANLLLTRTQKLYKVAMFIEKNTTEEVDTDLLRDPNDFDVIIYDNNITHLDTQNAAYYFYKDFLGCDLMPTTRKLTRDFYNLTTQFINTANIGNEQKVDFQNSLCNYLKVSRETVISVSDFGDKYFAPEMRDSYYRYMAQNSFPTHAIHKDTSLIDRHLRKRRMCFDTKVRITAPYDDFTELVIIEECDDPGYTRVKIKGKIEAQ